MKNVDIVIIDKLLPLYKDGIEANAIQVARIKDLDGNSCQFNIVVGKGLYKEGDKAIYIMPDYCLPDREIFKEYIAPNGDPKKCRLGKNGRIRAIKFNFTLDNSCEPVYSNGVLVSVNIIRNYINGDIYDGDLQKELGIIKYVAPDTSSMSSGLTKGDLPYFLYATDETRIELLKDHVDKCYNENEILSFTLKRDGSSASLYVRKDLDDNLTFGVCSRLLEKKLYQTMISAYKDDGVLLHPYINPETKEKGWFNDSTQKFYTSEEVKNLQSVEVEVRDAWVDTVKKFDYLDKLIQYCKDNNIQLALRGELIGKGCKGGGNKLNMDSKEETHIVWFGVDSLESGHATRIHYGEKHNLATVCEAMDVEYTPSILEGVFNYDQIIYECTKIFNKIKEETGQIVEGIVIRSKYSNKLSTKFINPEYDAKS